MKNTAKILICLAMGILLIACGQFALFPTPTPSPVPTGTLDPELVAIFTNAVATTQKQLTETAVVTTTPSPSAIPPHQTLIPTIDPTKVPGLLQSALSVETLDAFHGHNLKKITGWSYGFNAFRWLDTDHLLLYPIVGDIVTANFGTIANLYPAVINLTSKKVWLPPSNNVTSWNYLGGGYLPRWSAQLGILITSEKIGEGETTKEGVSIYTPDGNRVAGYEGKLVDISPSATKMLISDDIWVDLSNGETVDFAWGRGVYTERWLPIWSSDESQVYECCYFYGNAKTDKSYAISDESTILEGHQDNNPQSLEHSGGIWLNNNYVLAQFDGFYTFRNGPIPIFDISARTFRNLGVVASLPEEFNNLPYTSISISPNRDYMWISPGLISEIDPKGYLVDLRTLKSQLYHYGSLDWSANGKYAILDSQILSLSSKILRPLPTRPGSAQKYLLGTTWHPTEGIRASVTVDESRKKQTLFLLDIQDLSYRQVVLPPVFFGEYNRPTIFWSPKGEHIVLLAADNSLWQIDYPKLDNLEQLTPPTSDTKEILWSSDGASLAFIGNKDIYIVDTKSNP